MRFTHSALIGALLVVFLSAACTPLRRGFDGESLVSPARPSFSVSVKALPLLASGQITPLVYTQYGYALPETLVAVYGSTLEKPLAVSVLAFTPDETWAWDPLSFSMPDSPISSEVRLGEQAFAGSLHVVQAEGDPFARVLPGVTEENAESVRWLAQRFACLLQFKQAKLILEYREPLPASLTSLSPGAEVPAWNADVRAFQERAAAVFAFSSPYAGPPVANADYIKTLDVKRLGVYLGSLGRNSIVRDLANR